MRRKGICIVFMILAMAALAGCGGRSAEKIVEEERTYPDPDAVAGSLEDAGFTVEKSEGIEEIGVEATRIKAEKDGEYLDACYHVASSDDRNKIVEYYTGNYKKYNLVSDNEVVYCYSSESVLENTGLD